MAQKIVIQEADQWPKKYVNGTKPPRGVEFFIGLSLEGTIFMAKESNPAPIEWQSKPDWWNFEYGIRLGFNSFKSAIEWWLNPQPIDPPNPLTFGELAVGDRFVAYYDDYVLIKIEHEEYENGNVAINAVYIAPHHGTTYVVPTTSVRLFRGTITVKEE